MQDYVQSLKLRPPVAGQYAKACSYDGAILIIWLDGQLSRFWRHGQARESYGRLKDVLEMVTCRPCGDAETEQIMPCSAFIFLLEACSGLLEIKPV